ncbi:agmatine deiminase family protein [Zafaria sp. Z1313]|uniref:agmatine deiminase family protein n=1 Tax=unclassified Zafaria TaxID=2828765 RepID=UPI002E77E5B7|nr:agmatine deiminase family protein [Zafaria sp. J156]MEE1619778.1 agmatine deiminase family protein [Zafaria sp. J156]
MPAETGPQERVWMAFPSGGYTLGDSPQEAEAVRRAWAATARAVSRFAPVTMVVDPSAEADARRHLGDAVEYVCRPLDDAWMRDIGPTFVRAADGSLAAIDWGFNGWGTQDWASWDQDSAIAAEVAGLAGVPVLSARIVNEGGGIHVDGEGTVLATETVQLDPGRNPGATRADVEAEFARLLGATKTIWLPCGLTRDNGLFGTRGHVDLTAAIPSPGTVLLHEQRNPAHPDFEVSRRIRAVFESTPDAAGRPWRILPVPAPAVLHDAEGWVDYSYINHLVVNGGVIACTFGDANDAEALAVLAEAYPGREVVGVDARELFARGGGIHCITQQQPARLPAPAPAPGPTAASARDTAPALAGVPSRPRTEARP